VDLVGGKAYQTWFAMEFVRSFAMSRIKLRCKHGGSDHIESDLCLARKPERAQRRCARVLLFEAFAASFPIPIYKHGQRLLG
jgi:hypothetical protein